MKNGGPVVALEPVHEGAALLDAGPAVQHEPGTAEDRGQVLRQRLDDLPELGEDQRALLPAGELLADLRQPRELAAVGRHIVAVTRKLAGMIADLLQVHQRPQHQSPPRHPVAGLHVALQRAHDALVERDLRAGQGTVADRLGLVRQVADDVAVRLQTPQDVGRDEPPQRCERTLVAPLQGLHEPAEHRARTEQSGVEKVEQRPQVRQTILHRRPRQHDARVGR